MTGTAQFSQLLRHDLRRLSGSPALWLIVATIVVAAIAGARNAATLHATQRNDARLAAEAERAWYDSIGERVRRYRQLSGPALPYWQDPTDAAGFSRYFLRRHATKPHLPLSPLAVGHSDLQPYVVPLRLEGLFGGDPVYDYEHPRALALGVFDLAFVLTWLLPLGVGAIAALAGSYERDHGILPSVAAHPVSPLRWYAARGLAIGILVVPTICVGVVIALAVGGVSVRGEAVETAAATGLVAAQCALWLAAGIVIGSTGVGGIGTLGSLIGVWMIWTVGLPLGASAWAAMRWPAPSYAVYVDDLREAGAAVEAERDHIVGTALAAHSGRPTGAVDSSRYDYSTRLVTLTPEIERRLQRHADAREQHARAMESLHRAVSWLSPQIAFQSALEQLAGTSTARHLRFTRDVRNFQLELRAFIYPRVLQQATSPAAPACATCPARLSFVDFDAVPRFAFVDETPSVRARAAGRTAAWLLGLAMLAAFGGSRLNRGWAL
jgi:ABC-2 type transport system permease protein